MRRSVVGELHLSQIDELMERACEALVRMRYFEAERCALRALGAARREQDFDRMARITLPLQEARRQKMQLAMDAGCVRVLDDASERLRRGGLYLVQPPAIAIEARALVQDADRREVPVHVLTREPMTNAGLWPIAMVNGEVAIRARVAPPWTLEVVAGSPTRDRAPGPPDEAWFLAASEAVGDAAISMVDPKDHPHHRVEDLLEFLDCHPLHEKLHQVLADACRACVGVEAPKQSRRATRLMQGKWNRIGDDGW